MGTENTIVVDEQDLSLIKADGAVDSQIEPDPQTGFDVEEKTAADAPKSPDSPDEPATTAAEDAAEDAADAGKKEETKKSAGGNGYDDDLKATHKAIADMTELVTSTMKSLEDTMKNLNSRIDGVEKSVNGEVATVKATNDEFGKRVDAVEKDTAFRKSGDVGTIEQTEPLAKVDQPLWGGRFLNNSDLFNNNN